jgi:2-keto-3-deoxy-L-rhamnonate aldolase RhmA
LVDQQRGVIDYASMISMVRTAQHLGAAPVVRVPQNEP